MNQKKYLHNAMKLKIEVTYSTKNRPFWECNIQSFSKGIPNILWNLNIRYYDPKHRLFVSLLSKMNAVHLYNTF